MKIWKEDTNWSGSKSLYMQPFNLTHSIINWLYYKSRQVELMKSWPKYNMHCEAKCQLPPHPSQIQIVDMTEGYRVATADLQNSPAIRKLQTSTVSQMRVPLDLLFNPRPRWACLEDMRREVKSLQAQFGISRNLFIAQLQQYEIPAKDDLASQFAFVQHWIKHLYIYQGDARKGEQFYFAVFTSNA